MDVDVELQEVRETPPETIGLVSDSNRDLNDVKASVIETDNTSW